MVCEADPIKVISDMSDTGLGLVTVYEQAYQTIGPVCRCVLGLTEMRSTNRCFCQPDKRAVNLIPTISNLMSDKDFF